MLYSYQTQEPTKLPERIKLSDGSTRTSLSQLSEQELLSLGFTGPYTIPAYNVETEKVVWSSQDLQYQIIPLTQEELDARAAQQLQDQIQGINYFNFWNSVIISPVYQKIRTQACTDLNVNTTLTEFIAAVTDAKYGNVNVAAVQACINLLMGSLTLDQADIDELQAIMDNNDMSLIFTLPTI
jgi:hypothetical protein